MRILVSKLKNNPEQPRLYFDEADLRELGEDLKVKQLRPLWVLAATSEDLPVDLQDDEYLIMDGERRWRSAKEVGISELECSLLNMSYVDAYALAVKEHAHRAEHNEVEKARGVIRNYYDRLKGVEGFEVFQNGRTPEEAVVALLVHLHTFKDADETDKLNRAVRDLVEKKLALAETGTGRSWQWIRGTGRNILKIPLTLEREVAVLNYCAYHSLVLLCDYIENIQLLHRDKVTTVTQTGSRTPFVNFNCKSMRILHKFIQDEHGIDVGTQTHMAACEELQRQLPVKHHRNSPYS